MSTPARVRAGARRFLKTFALALTHELSRPHRRPRRVFVRPGAAHIELLGPRVTDSDKSGARAARRHEAVTAALTQLPGVDWAQVDESVGRVLVSFDEGLVDIADLVEAVSDAEAAFDEGAVDEQDLGDDAREGGERRRRRHPADTEPIMIDALTVAVDVTALGLSVGGLLSPVPALPRALGALVALLDNQPRARRAVERRIGTDATELGLALANAGVSALTQTPDMVATSALHHAVRLAERVAVRSAFIRREPELVAATKAASTAPDGIGVRGVGGDGGRGDGEAPGLLTPEARARRPQPLPRGPVDRASDQLAAAGLILGAASLATARSPGLAGELVLAAVPRAARLGREAFAATAARQLAVRGLVVMDDTALRRLDRVDTVVVSSSVLLGDACRVLSAPDAAAWSEADALLDQVAPQQAFLPGQTVARCGSAVLVAAHDHGERAPSDPQGLPLKLRTRDRRARLLAGTEISPYAEAVLAAARDAARLALTENVSTTELTTFADTVLPARGYRTADHTTAGAQDTSIAADLAESVWRLQAEGACVLLVAAHEHAALHRADVGVGVVRPGARPAWSADVLCLDGLTQAWDVLGLLEPARRNSARAATLARSGSALSGVVTLSGSRAGWPNRAFGTGPVAVAALAAMALGSMSATQAGRRQPPTPVLHTDWHALTADATRRRLTAIGHPPAARALTDVPDLVPDLEGTVAPGGRRLPRAVPAALASRASAGRALARGALARGTRRLLASIVEDLRDPLVPVLFVGAAASALLGSGIDAALVAGVSLTNAVVSGAQRTRAEAVLDRLVARHTPLARLLTDEGIQVVPANELRPGDLVDLRSPDVVPADGRLLETHSLELDEATLTGESLPMAKSTDPTPAAALAERHCMVYDGTSVLAGTGRAVVVATGAATEAGRAAAAAGRPPTRGVQARLVELTRLAVPLTGLAGVTVGLLSLARGATMHQALSAGVAIAVAAVPEGLPLVATAAQVAATRRLARLGVLVRSSRTVEASGRVDTVCLDKTGTLTEGRLVLRQVVLPGAGQRWGRWVRRPPYAGPAATVVRLAAFASPDPSHQIGHATDRAVLAAAAELSPSSQPTRHSELPFETSRGYAATVVSLEGEDLLAVKGAPERIVPRCRLDQASRDAAIDAATSLAAEGLRVLAVARRAYPSPITAARERARVELTDRDIDGLELVGFVGLADPPRPSAAPAMRRLTEAGLRITLVTGDHPATAAQVAAEVGIPNPHAVVTGPELDRLGEEDHARQVAAATVFARVSPEQKVRLVHALQAAGRVVAMTGDGTNDAAAIRAADVGVAIAGRGSAAARGSADLLLGEPDIERLADAVVEGRRMWAAVTAAVSVLVGGNAGEVAFTVAGTAIGRQAPLNPRQLLLVNLFTDMAPAMALAVRGREPVTPGDGTIPEGPIGGGGSRGWLAGPLRRMLIVRGTATAAGSFAAWLVASMTGTRRRASTVGLIALVFTQLGQTITLAGLDPLVLATALGSAAMLAVLIQTPATSWLFGSRPVGPVAWATAVGCAAAATLGAWAYERRAARAVDTSVDTSEGTAGPIEAGAPVKLAPSVTAVAAASGAVGTPQQRSPA